MKRLRCAIYTRKSTEEGLEQAFNTLHAQREACAAYVLSQAGEGWEALPQAFDDGGYSGGSMNRPALKALLDEIRQGAIDIVVVYKVDRLTRALSDFAKIVDLFDAHSVSFVSVTQAFNTTTSMGRLTLNVLLSFAQFEREVAGERIRDKIAASKAKGLWMGGSPPLGYEGLGRKLVVNPNEAEVVRHIFARYLELGSVRALLPDLEQEGIRSKRWTSKAGNLRGGSSFSRGALYHLLSNPTYRGAIRHKAKVYPNAHPEIIDLETWEKVQVQLRANGADRDATPLEGADVLFAGRVHDDRGIRMHAVHTKRQVRSREGEDDAQRSRTAKRYRYYASPSDPSHKMRGSLPRVAMGVLDDFIVDQVDPILSEGWGPGLELSQRVDRAVTRVVVGADLVTITLRRDALVAESAAARVVLKPVDDGLALTVPIRLKHRNGALILTPAGTETPRAGCDRALIRAVCIARRYAEQIALGEIPTTKDVAKAEGLCDHYLARLMPLAWLAPDLVEMIVDGRQPKSLTLSVITKHDLPLGWDEQRDLFRSLA